MSYQFNTQARPGAGEGCRVRLDLRLVFSDRRARVVVWAAARRRARWLLARARRLGLRGPACLLRRGHLLPPHEPLALLDRDDVVQVIPLSKELPIEYDSEEESDVETSRYLINSTTKKDKQKRHHYDYENLGDSVDKDTRNDKQWCDSVYNESSSKPINKRKRKMTQNGNDNENLCTPNDDITNERSHDNGEHRKSARTTKRKRRQHDDIVHPESISPNLTKTQRHSDDNNIFSGDVTNSTKTIHYDYSDRGHRDSSDPARDIVEKRRQHNHGNGNPTTENESRWQHVDEYTGKNVSEPVEDDHSDGLQNNSWENDKNIVADSEPDDFVLASSGNRASATQNVTTDGSLQTLDEMKRHALKLLDSYEGDPPAPPAPAAPTGRRRRVRRRRRAAPLPPSPPPPPPLAPSAAHSTRSEDAAAAPAISATAASAASVAAANSDSDDGAPAPAAGSVAHTADADAAVVPVVRNRTEYIRAPRIVRSLSPPSRAFISPISLLENTQ